MNKMYVNLNINAGGIFCAVEYIQTVKRNPDIWHIVCVGLYFKEFLLMNVISKTTIDCITTESSNLELYKLEIITTMFYFGKNKNV